MGHALISINSHRHQVLPVECGWVYLKATAARLSALTARIRSLPENAGKSEASIWIIHFFIYYYMCTIVHSYVLSHPSVYPPYRAYLPSSTSFSPLLKHSQVAALLAKG